MISKIVGESFEIYCSAEQRFNVCIFKWEEENTENCIFIDNVYPWNCPGEMKRIDDKCIIRISSFDTLKHTGKNKSGKNVRKHLPKGNLCLVLLQVPKCFVPFQIF